MTVVKLVCGVWLLGCLPAFACESPALPTIPDDEKLGHRAERTVKADVLRYMAEMGAYVACIEAAHRAAVRDEAPAADVEQLVLRNNAAVAEVEDVRERYVANVGPFEELFFEQSFDQGRRRLDAKPQLPTLPRGPDRVLRRAEQLAGDCGAALECPGNKEYPRPGAARRR